VRKLYNGGVVAGFAGAAPTPSRSSPGSSKRTITVSELAAARLFPSSPRLADDRVLAAARGAPGGGHREHVSFSRTATSIEPDTG